MVKVYAVARACSLRQDAGVALLLAALPLFATQTLFNYPLGLMTLLGAWQLARAPGPSLGDPAVRLLLAAFACLWLPMVLALPDAVNLRVSLIETVGYLRFLFAGLFVLGVLKAERARRLLLAGATAVVAFWCLDALVQYFLGRDLFGYPPIASRLTGVFYPKQRLGFATAVMLPLLIVAARQTRWPWAAATALLVPAMAAVLLSSSRTAWLMMAFALPTSAFFLARRRPQRLAWGKAVLAVGLLALLVGGLAARHEGFRWYLSRTAPLFSGDYAAINLATSNRLPIWRTAAAMAREHWLNGVGPRGFRHAYRRYAAPEDPHLAEGARWVTHPHQLLLEVLAETGAFGLAGYLALWVLMFRSWRQGDSEGREASGPFLIAAATALLPTNAHHALYGSYWSSVSWWLLLPGIALLWPPRGRCPP